MACTDCNPSSANWNQCFTVINIPTDVIGGFNTLIGQICTVKGIAESAAVLPTFNNIGTCLASPGANDSLVSTITKLRTRICQSPTWNANNVTWGCVTKPTNLTSIEEGINNILSITSTNSRNSITSFSGDFVVSLTDPSNPCSGKNIALATPINLDRLVASNPTDDSPGTLIEKLSAGTNITLDDVTTPGQVIITASNGTGNHLVLADVTDDTPGYLDGKLNGLSGANITISTSYNSGTKKVDVGASIDLSELFTALLNQMDSDSTLYSLFCSKVAACPSNCNPPSSIQAIVV